MYQSLPIKLHHQIQITGSLYLGKILFSKFSKIQYGRSISVYFILFSGHTNFVLSTFENPASISPYRVNTSYRRPAGGDSDHGYSTMTPHEDSEHASLPCLEPLIKERYKPGSLSVVKNTPGKIPPPPSHYRRSRSPTPPKYYQPIPEQTVIPPQTTIIEHPNSVIANVQVHMVDTH